MATTTAAKPPRRLRVRFGDTTREQALEQARQQLRRRCDETPRAAARKRADS